MPQDNCIKIIIYFICICHILFKSNKLNRYRWVVVEGDLRFNHRLEGKRWRILEAACLDIEASLLVTKKLNKLKESGEFVTATIAMLAFSVAYLTFSYSSSAQIWSTNNHFWVLPNSCSLEERKLNHKKSNIFHSWISFFRYQMLSGFSFKWVKKEIKIRAF